MLLTERMTFSSRPLLSPRSFWDVAKRGNKGKKKNKNKRGKKTCFKIGNK